MASPSTACPERGYRRTLDSSPRDHEISIFRDRLICGRWFGVDRVLVGLRRSVVSRGKKHFSEVGNVETSFVNLRVAARGGRGL